MKRLAIALVAMIHTLGAWAGEDYRCKVDRLHDSSGEDTVESKALRSSYVGGEFTIDRRTGVMAGKLKNAFNADPVVIDYGSSENSFKAVTTIRVGEVGAGSSVNAIVVKEYVEADEKPFTFFDGDTVFFGKCEHF